MAANETPVRCWADQPEEIFWLEITDRDDLGVDLNAPAERESGDEYWSYAFIQEIQEGDVILHYRARPRGAITHWSRAVGKAYTDQFGLRISHPLTAGSSSKRKRYRPGVLLRG